MKCLFILKLRQDYSTNIENFNHQQVATGMFNSATFVSDMLRKSGHESKVVVVIDNNFIDREVKEYQPTHVFIEGYWVVPEKFEVLKKLHPTVKWVVRCHSEMPFLAQEGIAIDWSFGYWERGIIVSGNSPRINGELQTLSSEGGFGWDKETCEMMSPMLPNYYPVDPKVTWNPQTNDEYIDIGCFGAIRPMKNHLLQAVAAIEFAKWQGKKLRFHVNKGRIELYGQNAVKNLKSMFNRTPDHQLVEHSWTGHEEFLDIIRSMDMCMQVSFTETFNIVTADCVSVGCPVVASKEIGWMFPYFADPASSKDITNKMKAIWDDRWYYIMENRSSLNSFSNRSASLWNYWLNN